MLTSMRTTLHRFQEILAGMQDKHRVTFAEAFRADKEVDFAAVSEDKGVVKADIDVLTVAWRDGANQVKESCISCGPFVF